jgi:hypothetical protein
MRRANAPPALEVCGPRSAAKQEVRGLRSAVPDRMKKRWPREGQKKKRGVHSQRTIWPQTADRRPFYGIAAAGIGMASSAVVNDSGVGSMMASSGSPRFSP